MAVLPPLSPLSVNRPTIETSQEPPNENRKGLKKSYQSDTSSQPSTKKKNLKIKLFGRSRSSSSSGTPSPAETSFPGLSPTVASPLPGMDAVYEEGDGEWVDEDEQVETETLDGDEMASTKSAEKEVRFDDCPGLVGLPTKPAPFLRPLDHSLRPRYHKSPLPIPTFNSTQSLSPITIARHRGEAKQQLTGEDLECLLPGKKPTKSELIELVELIASHFSKRNTTANKALRSIYSQINRPTEDTPPPTPTDNPQIEEPADNYHRSTNMAFPYYQGVKFDRHSVYGEDDDSEYSDTDVPGQNDSYCLPSLESKVSELVKQISTEQSFADWFCYLTFYYRGQLNINNLPPPYSLSFKMKYLPALYTEREGERIRSCCRFDKLWPHFKPKVIQGTLDLILERLGHEYLCFSIFDFALETPLIDTMYGNVAVPRHDSLAAHALYSQDVLVVHDTHKDWRFKGNPFVVGAPNIRSFVAIPIVNQRGFVLAVALAASQNLQPLICSVRRRELAEIGSLILQTLGDNLKNLNKTEPCEQQVPAKNPPLNGRQRRHDSVVVPELVPSALNICKTLEQTPPPSADSEANFFVEKFPNFDSQERSRELKHTSKPSEHRPYSISDTTSFMVCPPGSPYINYQARSATDEESFQFSDDSQAWETDSIDKDRISVENLAGYAASPAPESTARYANYRATRVESLVYDTLENLDGYAASLTPGNLSRYAVSPLAKFAKYDGSPAPVSTKPEPSASTKPTGLRVVSVSPPQVATVHPPPEYASQVPSYHSGADSLISQKSPERSSATSSSATLSAATPSATTPPPGGMVSVLYSTESRVSARARAKFDGLCNDLTSELKYDIVYIAEVPAALAESSRCSGFRLHILGKAGEEDIKKVNVDILIKALRCDRVMPWAAGPNKSTEGDVTSGELMFIHSKENVKSSEERSTGFVAVCLRNSSKGSGRARCHDLVTLAKFKTSVQKLLVGPPPPKTLRSHTESNASYLSSRSTGVANPHHSFQGPVPKSWEGFR